MANPINSQLPDFMREDQDLGMEKLSQHIRPPRVKVLQSNRSSAYAAFKEGEVILTPLGLRVAELGQPFWFIPLLFYPEYCIVNPLELKGTLSMIRERTLDVNSPIAAKARDPERRRSESCPENAKYNLSYVEYLTYICVIIGVDGVPPNLPVSMSFSGAEHRTGSQLASLLKLRGCAIFGNVFEACVPKNKRENAKGSWFGLNVSNPQSEGCPGPFVKDPAEYKMLKETHLVLAEQLRNDLIDIDRDEDLSENAPSETAATI